MKLRDLTPDDWDGIAQYLAYLCRELRLTHWTIHLSQHPTKKRHAGSIAPVYGRKHATLFLSRFWPRYDAYEQKHTLIHELLHLYFFDTQSAVGRLEQTLDPCAFHLVWESHTEALEFAVDALADVLAARLDDPPALSISAPTITLDNDLPIE